MSEQRPSPLRIMVVDDDPANLKVITLMLRTSGLAVELYPETNGLSALERARSVSPDFVLMDVLMPGAIDGLEAIRRLKTDPGFHGVVIAQSALASLDDRSAGMAAGADDYLTKPYRKEDLLAMIRKHLP